jgi:HTH-type transcriptional regulator/antitoxin HipB
MRTLKDLGQAVVAKRKALHLTQRELAVQSGITRESLVRFEKGQVSEFGSRKLLALLAVLGLEMGFIDVESSGNLDELRRERSGA